MKIQELAIIFVIIILPISLLLSEYTQFQIQTINMQTSYDTQLTSATYDAIKAFQLNAKNETYSDNANLRVENIEASVNAFRNSIKSAFQLNGASEEEINNYIPALVYTLYDGFYIYSPYENVNYRYDEANQPTDENGEKIYGLKPYISYSCRYKTTGIDVIITYALDNCVTVQGMIGTEYVNKTGYLIDGIKVVNDTVTYNGIVIEAEQLTENIGGKVYKYIKKNGTKYYWDEDNDRIIYISNGTIKKQVASGENGYEEFKNSIENNDSAKQYYKEAYEFTDWFKQSGLSNLKYSDAYDEVINQNGTINITRPWKKDNRTIFEFNSGTNAGDNIENELSNFNQHRLAVIRHKIETNLAIAISNYNEYSGSSNVFQMPELKDDEWEHITHNICLISFMQGLHIGGKIYNGYSLVTNSESEEVVIENNIYILGENLGGTKAYHRIGDKGFEDGTVKVDSGVYGDIESAGRLNLDFEKVALTNSDATATYYYYPLDAYNASYDSIVMQNNVTTYDDIYAYVNSQSNDLKCAFYTALGRERAGKYNSNITYNVGETTQTTTQPSSGTTTPTQTPTVYFTITYDANGGNGGPTIQQKEQGVDITLLAAEPTKVGYTFLGWSKSQTATTAEYTSGGTYTDDGDVTLYAVWEIKTYTLTLNANGGTLTSGGTTISLSNIAYGSNVIIPAAQTPSRNGYTFLGWATSSTATIAQYAAGNTITISKDTTLYAVWQQNTSTITDPVTITFNLNGGTGVSTSEIVERGSSYTLPAPSRTGYVFTGWTRVELNALESKLYSKGETITVNADVTFKANWMAGSTI